MPRYQDFLLKVGQVMPIYSNYKPWMKTEVNTATIRGLLAIAAGQLPQDAAIQAGLDAMLLGCRLELVSASKAADTESLREHATAMPTALQLSKAAHWKSLGLEVRATCCSGELHEVLKLGINGPSLVQRAAHVASRLQAMSITPQEAGLQAFGALWSLRCEPGEDVADVHQLGSGGVAARSPR